MKQLIFKIGQIAASIALIMATVNVNSTCAFYNYQEEVPQSAKKLRRF